MRRFMMLGVLLAALCFLAGGVAYAADVTLNLGHVGAPESPQQTIAELFAQKVSEKTGGEVEIRIHHSGVLGSEKDLQAGVRSGVTDIAIAGTFSHFLPWAGILETPLLYRDFDHFLEVYTGPVGQELMAAVGEELGTVPLFIAPHGGFRYVTTRSTPIRRPEDFQRLKLRNPNVPAFNVMAKVVGAIPVPIDFAELYIALDRGVVDGQHNPVGHVVGSKFYEVQDYLSMIPWGISPHIVQASRRAWGRLSEAQQQAVLEAARETAAEYPALAIEDEAKQLQFLEDKITIVRPDEIAMDQFTQLFVEKGIPALEKEYGEAGMHWVRAIVAAGKN